MHDLREVTQSRNDKTEKNHWGVVGYFFNAEKALGRGRKRGSRKKMADAWKTDEWSNNKNIFGISDEKDGY